MDNMFAVLSHQFRLFRQPKKVGDCIDLADQAYLIVGIQSFKILGKTLTVRYICQKLDKTDYIDSSPIVDTNMKKSAYVLLKHDDERLNITQVGHMQYLKGSPYMIDKITDIEFVGTDVNVSVILEKMRPISRKQLKAKYNEYRKNKMEIEVY